MRKSLHEHEEKLRAMSLEAIRNDAALTDHLDLVSEAMNGINTPSLTITNIRATMN